MNLDVHSARNRLGLATLAVLAASAAGAVWRPAAFFPAYMVGFLLAWQLSIGALGMLLVDHLIGGAWSRAVRRPLEAAAALMPLVAVLALPHAMLVSPLQATRLFKQVSGYSLVTLLAFSVTFGSLRRMPALAAHLRRMNTVHQVGGVLMLMLLAAHVGQRPSGFLLFLFHGMAMASGAGAWRALLGARAGRRASTALLAVHIGGACLVAAGALLHLYFVYAYTA